MALPVELMHIAAPVPPIPDRSSFLTSFRLESNPSFIETDTR